MLHCDMTGAYISKDGGTSWRMFNLGTGVNGLYFDPADPNVVYGYNVGLWRSEDCAATWKLVWPNPTANVVEHLREDHANYSLSSEDPSYPSLNCHITAMAVDPGDKNRLCLVYRDRQRSTFICASEDFGRSWDLLKAIGKETVRTAWYGPALCVLTDTGIHAKDGRDWAHRPGPTRGRIVIGCSGNAQGNGGRLIYAGSADLPGEEQAHRKMATDLHVSADDGETWVDVTDRVKAGIGEQPDADPVCLRTIACCDGVAETAYLSYTFPVGKGVAGLAARCGIAKTDDGGLSWSIVWEEQGKPSDNMQTTHIETRMPDGYPNIYYVSPHGLGVAPGDPDTCFATDLFRTYRTTDGGGTWKSCHSERVGEDCWRTTGLDVTTNYGVHFDPFDPAHLLISYTDIGPFQSRDGGESWSIASIGIPSRWRNTAYWFEFDPEVKDLLWGVFALNHDIPRPKMWRGALDPARYEGGVALSTDGGNTWTVCDGLPPMAATHVLMDPTSPPGNRTLYVCGFGRGVFKSTDNGKTWELKRNGLEGEQPFAWRITRADDGTLYLVVSRRSEHGEFGDENDGALYRSTDGAGSWVKMDLPEGCNGPCGLTMDPEDNQRMYLSAWGIPALGLGEDDNTYLHPKGTSVGEDTGGGVFLSEDSGQSWRNIFDEGQHVYDLTVAPGDSNVLYVCGFDSAAWRSPDRGETWHKIKGYNFKWGSRVIPDLRDPDKVYITTYGGSVWHGPAVGDPDAVGDIAVPLNRA
jgi:photosystem II stability/assembly factor-like uncharacterized protein